MAKIIKKLSVFSLFFIGISTPFAVVSCQSDDKYDTHYDFSIIDWSEFVDKQDISITKWIDGDTLEYVNVDKDGIKETDTHKLRIGMIDTPESHVMNDEGRWVSTEGLENVYAMKATRFGQKAIPVGTKARIVKETGMSYKRQVGVLMYGKHFEKSYAVNIFRAGLAMPFIDNGALFLKMGAKYNMLHYLGLPMANAFNYARQHKIGMFEVGDLSKILGIHGSTDASIFDDNKKSTSIYGNIDVDYWHNKG